MTRSQAAGRTGAAADAIHATVRDALVTTILAAAEDATGGAARVTQAT